jgi:hypothetical protein
VHDYIQWLFPLDEPSRFNADAPLLTPADRLAFRHETLAANLRRALDRMLAFYGLRFDPSDRRPHIIRSSAWNDRTSSDRRPGTTAHRTGCSPATITCCASPGSSEAWRSSASQTSPRPCTVC